MCDDLCAHGLTGTRRTEQQDGEPASVGILLGIVPVLIYLLSVIHLVDGMLQCLTLAGIHDDILKAEIGLDLCCLLGQFRTHLVIASLEELCSGDHTFSGHDRQCPGIFQRIVDLPRREQELGGHLQRIDLIIQFIVLPVILPALHTLPCIGCGELQLGEFVLRDLPKVDMLLTHGEYHDPLLVEFGECQIHVSEEFLLLLFPEGELRQAAAGIGQYTFTCHGPESLLHIIEIIIEKLLTVDRHGL